MSGVRRDRARALRRSVVRLAVVAVASAGVRPTDAQAQWVQMYETFYLQAPHNWTFRNQYQHADRLFNAFDYGHAILYETLWTKPEAPVSELEERIFDRLTKRVLVSPPRVPLEEVAIEPMYARLAPEAKAMFDWSHILHRQIYDVLADERIAQDAKDAEIQRLIAYYKTRPDLAFSSRPKSMELMQEQSYSLAFRQKFPKFNGLIWGYHWFQVGLYEPLLVGTTVAQRQAGVRATVARFFQMLTEPPRTLPYQMPMTSAIAPEFAKRYPEAAIIFDNLHSMHDVVSDILANPSVPRSQKRVEILRAGRLYRDDSSFVMPVDGWRTMSIAMGVENMGGPSVNFARELPTPSVTIGAVMQHDRMTGAMTGMKVGQMLGDHANMPGMQHGDSAKVAPAAAAGGEHAGHVMPPKPSVPVALPMAEHEGHVMPSAAAGPRALPLPFQMLRDPVIRRRVLADSALRRMLIQSSDSLPVVQRDSVRRWLNFSVPTP
jgi:hypothetical protein